MSRDPLLSALTYMGILLILLGLILVAVPILLRLGVKIEKVHPLLFLGGKIDGLYLGTSPLLIIIMAIIYLIMYLIGTR